MLVKELIKVLESVNPENEVTLSLGRTQEYRDMCAKAELINGECLAFLRVDKIEIYPEDSDLWADIILQQDNICNLEGMAEKFDKAFTKIELESDN